MGTPGHDRHCGILGSLDGDFPDHMVVLWHDEQHWNRQIAVVQGEQNQLRTDIRELRNPKALSKMIQGTAPIPNPVFTTP